MQKKKKVFGPVTLQARCETNLRKYEELSPTLTKNTKLLNSKDKQQRLWIKNEVTVQLQKKYINPRNSHGKIQHNRKHVYSLVKRLWPLWTASTIITSILGYCSQRCSHFDSQVSCQHTCKSPPLLICGPLDRICAVSAHCSILTE